VGGVWIKHFELEMEKGNTNSKRRIETRVLVKNASNNGLYGVTYRWGNSIDNAALVLEEGETETFTINDGGTNRLQVWNYPSRSDCLACHTPSGGYVLGFNTAQLNREHEYPLAATNQIIALRNAGYLNGPTNNIHLLPRMAAIEDEAWSREYRVRSYLAANCANCHNPEGVERARWDGRLITKLSEMNVINGELLDPWGDSSNRVVVPGIPEQSVLWLRMSTRETGHMPPLGTTIVDDQALALIEGWIREDLKDFKSFEDWIATFDVSAVGREEDADGDGASNYLEYLTGTDPEDPIDAFSITIKREIGRAVIEFPQAANRGFEVNMAETPFDSWSVLDLPSNAPFFSATNRVRGVAFPMGTNQSSFYRVRVFEP
jgi:hypothetical protein